MALGLLAGSSLLAVVVGEILLRLFFPISYSMEVRYVPDGHLGFRLENHRVYTLMSGGTCTINNLGYRRTTDLTYHKPSGTVRVVALGGSSTFSFDVSDHETWTAVLESKLIEHYGDHVEVINAGVPGYDVFQSKINYLYRVRFLDPDIVIIYHTWNDMKAYRTIEAGRPFLRSPQPGTPWSKRLLRHSQIAWRVRHLYHDYVVPQRRENTYGAASDKSTESITAGEKAHRWEEQNFQDLAMLLEMDGVVPLFTSQAGLLSRSNLHDSQVRSLVYVEYVRMTFEEMLAQWEATSRIIEGVARDRGVPFVDLYEEVPHTTEYFADHVHLTVEGNRRVADLLFEGIVTSPRADSVLRMPVTQ